MSINDGKNRGELMHISVAQNFSFLIIQKKLKKLQLFTQKCLTLFLHYRIINT
nr:MAG TPA: hypothetical protein [Caudoviricetes sp.]